MKRALLVLVAVCALRAAAATNNTFTVTAYCACVKCCGQWSGGPTASGKMPVEGVTVAGPRKFKFGTRIRIAGVGEFICPVCHSLFAPYLGGAHPRSPTLRRQARFVKKRLAELTPTEPPPNLDTPYERHEPLRRGV